MVAQLFAHIQILEGSAHSPPRPPARPSTTPSTSGRDQQDDRRSACSRSRNWEASATEQHLGVEPHPVEGVLAQAVPRLEHNLTVRMGTRIREQPLIDVQPVFAGLRHRRLVGKHHSLDRGIDRRLAVPTRQQRQAAEQEIVSGKLQGSERPSRRWPARCGNSRPRCRSRNARDSQR